MNDLYAVATDRLANLATCRASSTSDVNSKLHRVNSYRNIRSIEPVVIKRWNALNLPDWLTPFVQNVQWAKRYAGLLNDGLEPQLRKLAEVITDVARVSKIRMMNTFCSKKRLAQTLENVNKWLAADRLAEETSRRLKATNEQTGAIYAACNRLRGAVLRYVATAVELGRIKTQAGIFKFFCWLTSPKTIAKERQVARAWATASTAPAA